MEHEEDAPWPVRSPPQAFTTFPHGTFSLTEGCSEHLPYLIVVRLALLPSFS